MKDKERFFIPEKIKVGYQKRQDTYTGKLSYIIYYDKKGVLRKEKSWNSWRDEKIKADEFKNEPTEGFVLNKHVGGCKSGWEFRQSYCRIYDPRGFEFEITIENLLFILDWVDCIKGKGLSGKFIYAWEGTDLVLLPECTEEYKESYAASEKMSVSNFKLNDLVPGSLYKVKSLPYWSYDGKDELYDKSYAVYVDNVKFAKDFGRKYETKALFYNQTNNTVFIIDPKSILFEVQKDYLSKEEQDKVLDLFSKSAYSYNFWNTNGIVKEFKSINLKKYGLESYYFKKLSLINKNGDNVELLRNFIRYKKNESYRYSPYSSYAIKDEDLRVNSHSLILDKDTGKINIVTKIELGKVDEAAISNHNYHYRTGLLKDEEVYPQANPEDLKNKLNDLLIRESGDEVAPGYITTDGYLDYSLSILLQSDSFFTGQSNISMGTNIKLPIKI